MSTLSRFSGCIVLALAASACGKKPQPPAPPAVSAGGAAPVPAGGGASAAAGGGAGAAALTFVRPGMSEPVVQAARRADEQVAWAGKAVEEETVRLAGQMDARQKEWSQKAAAIQGDAGLSPADKAARMRDIRLETPEPPAATPVQVEEWDGLFKAWQKALVAKDLAAAQDAVERLREAGTRIPGMLPVFQQFLLTEVQPALEMWDQRPAGAAQPLLSSAPVPDRPAPKAPVPAASAGKPAPRPAP